MTQVRITRRSKNIGYNWTNKVVRGEIVPVKCPAEKGTYKDALADREHAIKVNSGGTYWHDALFVNGKRVTDLYWDVVDILQYVKEDGFIDVNVED